MIGCSLNMRRLLGVETLLHWLDHSHTVHHNHKHMASNVAQWDTSLERPHFRRWHHRPKLHGCSGLTLSQVPTGCICTKQDWAFQRHWLLETSYHLSHPHTLPLSGPQSQRMTSPSRAINGKRPKYTTIADTMCVSVYVWGWACVWIHSFFNTYASQQAISRHQQAGLQEWPAWENR